MLHQRMQRLGIDGLAQHTAHAVAFRFLGIDTLGIAGAPQQRNAAARCVSTRPIRCGMVWSVMSRPSGSHRCSSQASVCRGSRCSTT